MGFEELGANMRHKKIAERWFNRVFGDMPLADYEKSEFKSDAKVVGTQVLRSVLNLGIRASGEYSAAKDEYARIMEQKRSRKYPEALINRDAGTPLTVISAHYPLRADHEVYQNHFVDPLVSVLSGDRRAGYIIGGYNVNNPNRTEEREEAGIHFLTLDERHFEVVEEKYDLRRLKVDTYSADTLIALFGLSEEEHGSGEVVLLCDSWARQSIDQMAEAVRARIGKYPFIGTETPPIDPYEGHAKWDIYEFVPTPELPARPTLQGVLGLADIQQ
jgi:hypothetical protein